MSGYTLVVTVTILVIAFSLPNQLSALSANTFLKNQNRASAERMDEATVVRKIESQAHLKELREKREMDDDGIDLSTEGSHVRTRRQARRQTPMKSPSPVKKDSCGVDLEVHEKLEDVKNYVKITRENRKEIEKLLLKIMKERNELQQIEKNTSEEIEILMQLIDKTTVEGDALLQSEKKKANNQVSTLQTEIDRLKANKNSEDLSELRAQLVRTTNDVNQQKLMIDDMKPQRDFAESRKQVAVQRSNVCVKLFTDLKDMQNNLDGNMALKYKRGEIGNLDGLLSNKRNCCSQKGCDVSPLELHLQ
ncbi:hypothetical protein DAPPUDRAFT_305778 [Daphnia pulex]|uniref:Uncharacterized protein n=1 Tax=Daphnia pulex TaxID=6669 RepID=E9GSD8_DAPPU|nr:hypothetical protein DAPPUDRAFT_305778 [Daphnia pulex]|eukprot:EFX77595.1 hypothetical protein DAPPUDRAFT_305778 [Daphnia pulex]